MNNVKNTSIQITVILLTILMHVQATYAQTTCTTNSFEISVDNSDSDNLVLNWTTRREVNTSFFILEYGTDSTQLETSITIAAAGSSLLPNYYSYDHIYLDEDPVYIRLTLLTMEGLRVQTSLKVPESVKTFDPIPYDHITLK